MSSGAVSRRQRDPRPPPFAPVAHRRTSGAAPLLLAAAALLAVAAGCSPSSRAAASTSDAGQSGSATRSQEDATSRGGAPSRAGSASHKAAGSSFEGVYRVGLTDCVVTSVQMGFQVRWSGNPVREYYFFDPARSQGGKVAFSKENTADAGAGAAAGGSKVFVFDDREFRSGVFYDGSGHPGSVADPSPVTKVADLPGRLP